MRVRLCLLAVLVFLTSVSVATFPSTEVAQAEGAVVPNAEDLAVGVIVDTTNPRSMQLAREAGFTHAKMIVQWARMEPKRGRYTFLESSENDLDNVMRPARNEGMKLVVRVDGAPDWAGGSPAKANLDAVEAFYAAMASHAKGTIVAYEILNEPNLPFEWGGSPNPAAYTDLMKAAYRGVKKSDPSALVLGGGLSPATGGAGGTMEDVDFLRGMYAAGAKGNMDAVAVHNYGGNSEPDRDPGDCGICFRRAELYRQVMVEQGDTASEVWATEFGWLLDPGRNMGQYDWMRVSAEKQADYVVRSYRYARANWPWMDGMLLSNLDASTSPYHTGPQDGMPWFSILNKDYSPRPAWTAFKSWREQDLKEHAARTRAAAAIPTPSPEPVTPTPQSSTPTPTPEVATPTATPEQPAVTPTATPAAASPQPTATSAPANPASAPANPATRFRVTGTGGTGVNLRAQPRTDAASLAILMDGTPVEVIGADTQAGGVTWRNVRTVGSTTDGVTGWVSAQYLAP